MKKVKLETLIKKLEQARVKFKEKNDGVEPLIWSLRVDEGEIELSAKMTKVPFGYTSQTNAVYSIPEMSNL